MSVTGLERVSMEALDELLRDAEGLASDLDAVSEQAIAEARRRLREPSQPGWTCPACKTFNDERVSRQSACRGCGLARQT